MENDFKPVYESIIAQQHMGKPLALAITAVLLLVAAVALRTILYQTLIASGQRRTNTDWKAMEYGCLGVLFILGCLAGYAAFGQIVSALLSGGCFAFAGSGVVQQALVTSEQKK